MIRRSLVGVVVTVAAVIMASSPAVAAVRPFNAEQTLAGGCAAFDGDAVMTTDGAVRGFATCPSPSGESIRFFSRNPDGTVNPSQTSGFFGRVLGVTYDSTATYVLFQSADGVSIGKRTNAGAFSSRVVDAAVPFEAFVSGDVIAQNGQWFGVWSKPADDAFGQSDLFYAASALPVRHVTTTSGTDDIQPTLAYSGSMPVLIWPRFDFATGDSNLMVSKFISGAWVNTRVFASAGMSNFEPDMHIAAGLTFVTWYRDGFIWVASNPGGTFTSRMFNTGGYGPHVAASVTAGAVDHIFVTWTSFTQNRVFFAESASTGTVGGTWDGTHIGPTGSIGWATGGFQTKGTAVYATGQSVASRTQT
jgi:hypothetical protein